MKAPARQKDFEEDKDGQDILDMINQAEKNAAKASLEPEEPEPVSNKDEVVVVEGDMENPYLLDLFPNSSK